MLTLPVEKRDAAGTTLSALRRSGRVPAVVYGAHQASTSISVNAKDFAKVLREAGEATVVHLVGLSASGGSASGGGAALPTLIHEVDRDPITNHPRHIDFYAVTKGEKVEVAIPLTFVGESAAVAAGANLVKVLHELEVRADPMSLPHDLIVDLSALAKVDDKIHAGDITLPAGIELVTEPGEVVALAQAVVEEKEEVATPTDLSAIEVEKKGKAEDSAGVAGAESGEARRSV